MRVRITFQPYGVSVEVPEGENILRAAIEAGVHINASCGGSGTCGKCLVTVISGKVMGSRKDDDGRHRACRTEVFSDATIEVPKESLLDTPAFEKKRGRTPMGRAVFEELNTDWELDPPTVKHYLVVDPPTIHNNRSDVSRVLRAVKNHWNLTDIRLNMDLARRLPHVLREKDWSITSTVYLPAKGKEDYCVSDLSLATLTNIEAGNTEKQYCGIALDIGTTSLCVELLDLNSGKTLARISGYNPQRQFGADVISRIVFSQKKDGLQKLREVLVEEINGLIEKLLAEANVPRGSVCHMAAAGNTVMTQLLLGIDPKYLREAPYVPGTNFIPPMRAVEAGIDLEEHTMLFMFPCVASYVGGDITAGLLATGVYLRDDLTLYIDIGTNGEVAVGNRDWIMTASCSAGPAFEGGGIVHGTIAIPGAIEDFNLNPDTLEPMLITIGMEKPLGICGSGIISIVSELFSVGMLARNGKFESGVKTDRIREGEHGREYVLAWEKETSIDSDITINEADIDNLIRAKGAMYAGCQTLLESVHLSFEDVDRLIIAGAFGNYLNLENAITIGLLPDIEREKFLYVGNGSLAGARLLNLSKKMLAQAEVVSKAMTNVELSENTAFMDNYVASLFLPHTDLSKFPSVGEAGT